MFCYHRHSTDRIDGVLCLSASHFSGAQYGTHTLIIRYGLTPYSKHDIPGFCAVMFLNLAPEILTYIYVYIYRMNPRELNIYIYIYIYVHSSTKHNGCQSPGTPFANMV